MIQETNLLTNLLRKSIIRNLMTATADHVSFPTKIWGSVKFLVCIVNPFSKHKANQTDPNIQSITVHSNKTTLPGHSDNYYFPLRSLYSVTDVTISGWNIYRRTGINPQRPIFTTIPNPNSTSNYDIIDSIIVMSDIAYRGLMWHGVAKS